MKKCKNCVCDGCPVGCGSCYSKKVGECHLKKCQNKNYKYRNSIFYKIGSFASEVENKFIKR